MAQVTLNRVLDDIKNLDPDELHKVENAIRARLPVQISKIASPRLTPVQIEVANVLLRETIVTLPVPMGTDNESIDADLAVEYSDNHLPSATPSASSGRDCVGRSGAARTSPLTAGVPRR